MTNDDSTGIDLDWKNAKVLKFFIDLCLDERNKRGLSGSSLKNDSWERIREEFKEKMSLDLTKKQMKLQWDYMKRKYENWVTIVGITENKNYDPVTKKINWTDEKWEEEIKWNADAEQFRYKPLEYNEEMKALFDGIIATGKYAWGPSKEGFPEDSIDDVRIKRKVKKRKRRSDYDKVDDEIERRLLAAIEKTLVNSEGRPSIEECNKLLDEMQTLEITDPLYIAATCIFCESKGYRVQWIKMCDKTEEIRIRWISMLARRFKFI